MYKIYTKTVCTPPGYIKKILLVMKITTFLLFVALMQVSAAGLAQRLTLVEKDATLKQVFNEINKQTNYNILWSTSQVNGDQTINVNFKDTPLLEVLDRCLENTSLTYTIENKTIVIKEKEPSFLDNIKDKATKLLNLPADISGTVIDSTGTTLPGASVSLKGTGFTTTTDNKGNFTFSKVPQGNYSLIVTYIGYAKLERSIVVEGKDLNLRLALHGSSSQLDQIEVIAYGQTTQRLTVGSIGQVTAKEIAEQPVSDPLAALEDKVPGLLVTQSNGVPGSSFTIQIEGQNSILNGSTPLVIIDGIPFAPQNNNINQFNSAASPVTSTQSYQSSQSANPSFAGSGMSPLASINPSDIESISVLKDADATAIYGSQGANGVIIITTKKGKVGKTTFSANVSSGESQVTRLMPMMNTQQYIQMREEAFKNDDLTPSSNANDPGYAPDLTIFDQNRYTNWGKYLLGNTSHFSDANESISGGSANTQFLIGTGYHNETTPIAGNYGSDRLSFNVNLHHTSEDHRLTLDFNANYSYLKNNAAASPDIFLAMTLPPNFPALIDPNGNLVWNYKGVDLGSNNPFFYLDETYLAQTTNLITGLNIDYKFLPGLEFRLNAGYNSLLNNETSTEPLSAQDPASNPVSSANLGTNQYQNSIIEPQLEFNKVISKGKLDILLGGSYKQYSNSSTSITGYNFPDDALLTAISDAASVSANNNYAEYKYEAIFARLNYIWDSKFILDFTGRRDGSSRFGPGKQFGNFGSAGAGWIFSEESFIKDNLPFLSFGKLRGSFGITGSDQIGDYQYLSAWEGNGQSYQGTSGFIPHNAYNPNFSWEVDKKLAVGLDLGAFHDRVLLSLGLYRNRTGNQLINYTLPTQTGFSSVVENLPALVQNSGWEIQLTTVNIKSTKFNWHTTFNISGNQNKLIAFPGLNTSSYSQIYVIGQPLNTLYLFNYVGVNPQTGLYQFRAANGTITSNPFTEIPTQADNYTGDETQKVNLNPKFTGAIGNSFTYERFNLDVFFNFRKQIGPNLIAQENLAGDYPPGFESNLPTSFLNHWQNPGDNSDIERLTTTSGSPAYNAAGEFIHSTGAYTDASFIRLKTLSLSYDLTNNFLKNIRVQKCRVYLNAQNLLTITDYKGNDPETLNYFSMPPLRTIVAGLQFTLN